MSVPGARDFVGYGRHVPRVTWPNGARIAVSVQVNVEEGAEYTYSADGRNETVGEFLGAVAGRDDLAIQSSFEYGSRAGLWRVARILDEYGVPATFNACATAIERNPEVGAYLEQTTHEVCCHGLHFEELWQLDRDDEREHLNGAIASLTRTCGERPRGWCSRLMPSPNTRELLVEEGGFVYDSDALNDDLPYVVEVLGKPHVVVPLTFTYNDGRFILGSCDDPDAFATYCCRAFDELWREGETHPKMMTVSLHPRLIGQAGRAASLRAFVEHALGRGDVWFARRLDIARWWLEHHEQFARD